MNKRLYWILAFVVVAVSAFSAPVDEQVDLTVVSAIKAEGIQNSQVMETVKYLTDVNGPRLSNSPGYMNAAKWSRDKLSEWGLKDARLEPWGEFGRGWSLDYQQVYVSEPVFFPVTAYAKAWTKGTDGEISGTPVLVEIRSEEDFEKYKGKLSGAIVLTQSVRTIDTLFEVEATRHDEESLRELAEFTPRERPQFDRAAFRARFELQRKVNEFLKSEGVAVTLEPSMWDEHTVRIGRGGDYQADGEDGNPSLVVSAEHYNRIVRMVEAEVGVTMVINIKTSFYNEDLQGYNVIAEIPGTDPELKDEVVMLGGHLDSWHAGTGAADNASGCAVAMEAVRILQTIGVKPRRTIRIALWGAEEQGLHGSRGYVKNHFADPTDMKLKPEHEKLSVYFNMDNGTGAFRGVYLQGNDAVRPIFDAWLEPFHDMGAETLAYRNTGGTDHLAFDAVGLPGFQFIQDRISYSTRNHHSNLDVFDQLIESDLIRNSVIMASFVYNAAMRNEKIPRKPLPEPQPERRRF